MYILVLKMKALEIIKITATTAITHEKSTTNLYHELHASVSTPLV